MASTALELFAGAGGTSQGLVDAGFRVLAAIENDQAAAETLRINHAGTEVLECDIREICPKSLQERLGLAPGELTLLAACPPCQGFSTLGRGDPADSRNDLVTEIWRFVREFTPAAVLIENVAGFGKDSRSALLFRQLRAIGYSVKSWIVDARDFGVPQHRRRLIAIAVRNLNSVKLPEDLREALPPGFPTQAEPADVAIAAAGPIDIGTDPLHASRQLSDIALERIRNIPPGGSHSDLPERLRLDCHKRLRQAGKGGATSPYGRIRAGEPSPTMTTRCTTVSCGRFVHPKEDRAISLREAALLQTFPPEYAFAGRHHAIERQIGNALPVLLAQAAGLIVQELLRNTNRHDRDEDRSAA